MTAVTARRVNFDDTTKQNLSSESINNDIGKQKRVTDEIYPELSLGQQKKHEMKLRYKTILPTTVEDASEDEESVTINNCLSSTRSLDECVLPSQRHGLFTNHDFFSQPFISPKYEHQSLRLFRTRKTTVKLSREFNDFFIRRNKRSHCPLLGERLNGGVSFKSPSTDFLDLPPIPETTPSKKEASETMFKLV